MTAKQLIEKLSGVDPDLEIYLALDDEYCDFGSINEVILTTGEGILLTPKDINTFDYWASFEVEEMPRL